MVDYLGCGIAALANRFLITMLKGKRTGGFTVTVKRFAIVGNLIILFSLVPRINMETDNKFKNAEVARSMTT